MSSELIARLKLEAQMHAQEARTANATIAEIYQLCTGATGEPGNWHGAEPVRAAFQELRAENERLRSALERIQRVYENTTPSMQYSMCEAIANSALRKVYRPDDTARAALEQSK